MQADQLPNPQLVTIAVALVGGELDYADIEDIAIKADEMAPSRFGWRKYPERIDLESVRVALRDAKKPKYGALVVGSNADGWMLSPSGLKWVQELDLQNAPLQYPVQHRRDSIEANLEAERARMRHSEAYRLYSQGDCSSITVQDFYRFARVNEYFGAKSKQKRYTIVSNAVAGDKILSELWAMLSVCFQKEILVDGNHQAD